MMRWLLSVGRVLCLWLALMPGRCPAESHEAGSISEVKAAFVYNFLQFTAWQTNPAAPGSSDVVLCAYARGVLADALAALDGNPVETYHLRVKLWPESPRGCRVVFLAAAAMESHGSLILHALRETSHFAIAEDAQTSTDGVSISLFEDGDRLAFAINLEVARKHGLTFSSKLLRLAKSVYPRPEDEP